MFVNVEELDEDIYVNVEDSNNSNERINAVWLPVKVELPFDGSNHNSIFVISLPFKP